MKKTTNIITFLTIAIILLITGSTFGYPGGVSGRTLKGPNAGCTCHTSSTSGNVSLTISGPATLAPGATGNYQVMTTYTSTISAGGINIAASNGTLTNRDTHLKVLNSELTHPSAQNAGATSLTWMFTYKAPATIGTQTLYATGCAVFSQWNNAANFTVTVAMPTDVNDPGTGLKDFSLEQNYPNPFNPSTQITYNLKEGGLVTLKIFNSIGQQVAELVNRNEAAGIHSVQFDGKGLNSGIYIYALKSGNSPVLTRKMILMK